MVTVQSILLTPLKIKLQALEYRRRWWNPFVDKHLAQKQPPEVFLKRFWNRLFSCGFHEIFKNIFVAEHFRTTTSAGLRVPGNGSEGVHSKQIFRLVRNCQNYILQKTKKIVIEGISQLVKQPGSCTCTRESCMVDRSGCSCCNSLLIEKGLCHIKFFK